MQEAQSSITAQGTQKRHGPHGYEENHRITMYTNVTIFNSNPDQKEAIEKRASAQKHKSHKGNSYSTKNRSFSAAPSFMATPDTA